MLIIIGTFRIPPHWLAEARGVMAAMVTASRAEAGCLAYDYAEDLFDPGLIHVSERWIDREALDLHFASAHIAAWRAAWPGLGIGERALTLYEGDDGGPV